jgi:hypothetical protein
MFARIFLADLFVHGIGGAKYDQLTDSIIEQFFGFAAPPYMVATATVLLPIARTPNCCARLPEVREKIRRMEFQPDRFVDLTPETSPWIAEKERWIRIDPLPDQRRQRHLAIERANEALRQILGGRRAELMQEYQRLAVACRNERSCTSREFSFCLFPEETLRQLLLDI